MLKLKPITLSQTQLNIIKGFGRLKAEHWNRNKTRLKDAIRDSLKREQNGECVYCGCLVHGTGDVDHIAHKARYPQFLFTPLNLAYACRMCNEDIKGDKNTVAVLKPDYEQCEFLMVHPYLDDIDRFFDQTKPIIAIKDGLNQDDRKKAEVTIELLGFKSPSVTQRRAEYFAAMSKAKENNTTIAEMAIENTITYVPYH